MEHTPEFNNPKKAKATGTPAIAKAYARLFSTPDGEEVLADLVMKFNPRRPRFSSSPAAIKSGRYETPEIIEGECRVVLEIEESISAGAAFTHTNNTK